MYRFLRFIPKNHLSLVVGKLVHVRLPRPIARWAVDRFARAFSIDRESASHPISSYPSIGAFFTRDLKEGVRPVEGDLVSPVDGTLRNYGRIGAGRLEQIKGKSYSVKAFLGGDSLASSFDDGIFFNLYLSPQDYHHVHSPVAGKVVRSAHVPGKLWPVNDWSMANIDDLFSVNERIITYIDSDFGLVAVVMVGATNVGRMSVVYDSFISNSRPSQRESEIHEYSKPYELAAGSRLGTFHMGSTVVMLFRPGTIALDAVQLPQPVKVRYGQALLTQPS
ncbi:MAG TPA: archaetidylserine decarboxylase [Thermoanaerobaculia bacterium]|nr:archaetidylserine decarboxylase [Thermoanaerobaculia bacterium]